MKAVSRGCVEIFLEHNHAASLHSMICRLGLESGSPIGDEHLTTEQIVGTRDMVRQKVFEPMASGARAWDDLVGKERSYL